MLLLGMREPTGTHVLFALGGAVALCVAGVVAQPVTAKAVQIISDRHMFPSSEAEPLPLDALMGG